MYKKLVSVTCLVSLTGVIGVVLLSGGAAGQSEPAEPVANTGVTLQIDNVNPEGVHYEGGVVLTPVMRQVEDDNLVQLVMWHFTARNPAGELIIRSTGTRSVNPDASQPMRKFSASFAGNGDAGKLGIGSFGFYFEVAPASAWRKATQDTLEAAFVVHPVDGEQAWGEWVLEMQADGRTRR